MSKGGWLSWLRGSNGEASPPPQRPREILTSAPAVTYVIGDIHGCLTQLRDLEAQIVRDATAFEGDRMIVTVGDYVDRGPASAQVIDHLLAKPPTGFSRICLAGNHDEMMLSFMESPARTMDWLAYGGEATLRSYGIDTEGLADLPERRIKAIVAAHVPDEHRDFLARLPALLSTPNYVVSHAGLNVEVALELQTDADLMWLRDNYETDYSGFGRLVVHGHMPIAEPYVSAFRIGIDTGAFASGRLSVVRLVANNPPLFLVTNPQRTRT